MEVWISEMIVRISGDISTSGKMKLIVKTIMMAKYARIKER
jgi:hypothetical protein